MSLKKLICCASISIWISAPCTLAATSEKLTDCPSGGVERQVPSGLDETLGKKLDLLNKVLHSGDKIDRVNASSHEKARLLLVEAAKSYEDALGFVETGCQTDANKTIDAGLTATRQAFALVSNQKRMQEQSELNYHLLRNRIDSFRKAIERTAIEKNISSAYIINQKHLNELLANADEAIALGDFIRASATLSDAASIIEAALVVVRANETLFHEKKFDSIEDAYQDEMETNRSYMQLLGKILATREDDNQKKQLISRLVKDNQESVKRSMAAMTTGNMEQALQLLETGTQKLIKAMRYFGLAL